MNHTIEAPFTLSDSDRSYISEKIENLQTYESRIVHTSIYFKTDDGNTPGGILAEIRVDVPGEDIFVSDSDADAMKAFTKACNAMKRQVKKRRDRMNDHHSSVKEINEIVNNTY